MPRKSASPRPASPDSAPSGDHPSGASPSGTRRGGERKPRTGGSRSEGRERSGGNPQRLQRVLASAGYGSRRQCEELIVEGRVEVDGRTVTELGTQVDPQKSKIYVDGSLLRRERPAYFVVNKPPGVVTTNRDPQGRTRVIDLVQERQRLFPVGRLDRSSEGLILLTNDGELAQQLAHPKYGVRKTYRVTVAGKVDNEKLAQMKRGIYVAEGRVAVDGARIVRHRAKATDLEILLREGKNREIRRILARLGHKVLTLQRVALGPLRLGELPRGAYRPVTSDELRRLRDEIRFQSRRAREARGEPSAEEGDAAAESDQRSSAGGAGRRSSGGKAAPASRRTAKPAGKTKTRAAGKAADGIVAGAKTKRSERPRPLESSKTVGTVIGGESEAVEPRPAKRKHAKPKGGGKRSPKKGGFPKSRGGDRQ